MKVLLSAYACEPGKGSEPGMGWHWAVEIARLGHDVHILTRANNVEPLKRGLAALPELRLTVHGYDLPRWARWWKKGQRGVRLYYLLWQWRALAFARRLHSANRFDLVHHITFAVYRHPSFMGRLGIPFVFGPVGGGEETPPGLRPGLPLRGRIAELLRSAANRLAGFDPLLRGSFRRASLILPKTQETLRLIPRSCRARCLLIRDVAAEEDSLAPAPAAHSGPRFLFAGRLLYWKGVHLALRALARLRRDLPGATLTLVGGGRDRSWLRSLARSLDIEPAVQWLGWIPHAEVLPLYASHTAFVFPSLHDSGGTVVMEALGQGLPVICLDLAGPGAILPQDCGVKIPALGRSEEDVVADLAESMARLATDSALHCRLAANALKAARSSTWKALVAQTYREIEARLAQQ